MPKDFDALRRREFSRLDRNGLVYADYTGCALYPESLPLNHARYLAHTVLGNPHAESGPSKASTDWTVEAKRRTLALLAADPSEYDVAFTANASGAMRILAEAFPFEAGSRLVLSADNHNSVNGLRLAARAHGAKVSYVPLRASLDSEDPRPFLRSSARNRHAPKLFAYPAQSNFSGVRHPLEWIRLARDAGHFVLLDAAAYLPSNALSLTEWPADFVALSFYKIFGYPGGVGALVARKEALARLRRGYFSGGTVDFASVQNAMVRWKGSAEAFEDGTPNFMALPAVCEGIEWFRGLGADQIGARARQLTSRFLAGLAELRGAVTIYGPPGADNRGGTVAFNLCAAGRVIPAEELEAAARAEGIALRSGCFCNPGAAERALSIPARQARRCLQKPAFTIPKLRDCLGNIPVGALRASFGPANNFEDIDRLLHFLITQVE